MEEPEVAVNKHFKDTPIYGIITKSGQIIK